MLTIINSSQDAQHELARSAVKSMSLKHGQDGERARHMNAIYTEMALNNARQTEAKDRINKEQLETVLKDATKDLVSNVMTVEIGAII